jgi:class 3 adenylate cyclase/tetratricopeptide (TPR) repeat protein
MEVAPRAIERKVITALFCDLVGSTELAERLDPEDIDRLLATYHRLARQSIEAHGGAVEKFIGDAVVGVFGAPMVHEDDAARAIRAAFQIIADLDASALGLKARIGIHTGEAVVRVGSERTAEEGFASGDTLNTAARLQSAALEGGIVAGDPSHRLAGAEFEWLEVGPITLKGKAEPVLAWRPLRPIDGQNSGRGEATPFLGRETELRTLIAAFERSVQEKKVELVTLVAEPGMGKSRLIRELGRHVAAHGGVTWLKGRCLPYGDGVSFWALGEIIKARAGILQTDDETAVADKLDRVISDSDPEARRWMRDRLAPLVGLVTEMATPSQDEAFSALARFLESLAADGPAVAVIEDLHWADPALVAFLIQFAESHAQAQLLLVVSARPEVAERHPDWLATASRSTLLQLLSLSDEAIRSLVAAGLAGASEKVVAAVLERAAGSPLYAEQLVALIRERGLGADPSSLDMAAIPLTIQALLAARIDGLPGELKPALLDASVVGRVFWSGAVAAIESDDQELVDEHLIALARRALTREHEPSAMEGEAEYSFWHALLRDVAYSFLPRPARLAKHRGAAAWITQRAGGRLGDLAEIVADHLERALELAAATGSEDQLPAIRSDLATALLAAADHSIRMEPDRAVGQLRRALELLDAADRRRPDAFTALGHALRARTEQPEAARAFEAAIAGYRDIGESVLAAETALAAANALRMAGDGKRAIALITTARPVLQANPGRGLVDLHIDDARSASRVADSTAAINHANAAIDLAASLGLEPPYEAMVERAQARFDTPEGRADFEEGVRRAIENGNNRYAAVAMANMASTLDNLPESLDLFGEAIATAARFGIADGPFRALRMDTLQEAGRWDDLLADASALLAEAIERGDAYTAFMVRLSRGAVEVERATLSEPGDTLLAEAAAVGLSPGLPAPMVALDYARRGDASAAKATILQAIAQLSEGHYLIGGFEHVRAALAVADAALARKVVDNMNPKSRGDGIAPLGDLARAVVLEAEGDLTEALRLFEATASFHDANGWVWSLCRSLAGVGRCRVALGSTEAGLEALRQAREIAARLGAKWELEAIDRATAGA